jgi:hypothetical protein
MPMNSIYRTAETKSDNERVLDPNPFVESRSRDSTLPLIYTCEESRSNYCKSKSITVQPYPMRTCLRNNLRPDI